MRYVKEEVSRGEKFFCQHLTPAFLSWKMEGDSASEQEAGIEMQQMEDE